MDQAYLEALLEQAKQADADQDSETAVAHYNTILANTTPEDPNLTKRDTRLTALDLLTLVYLHTGNYEEGAALAEQYHHEASTYYHQKRSLFRIGAYAYHVGDNKRGLRAYQTVHDLAETQADQEGLAYVYSSFASIYLSLGRLDDAINYFQKAIKMLHALGKFEGEANAWNRLGLVYQQIGEIEKAIKAHQRYLTYFEESKPDDLFSIITGINNLGENYLLAYDMQTAKYFFERGLTLSEKKFYPPIVADLYRNQGIANCYLGDLDVGMANLHQAFTLGEEAGEVNIIAQVLYSLGLAELDAGHKEVGFTHAKSLLSLAGEGSARAHYANAIHLLGRYYQQMGEPQTAEKYWQEAVYLAHEMGQRLLLLRLHTDLATIAATPSLTQVHVKIAADIINQIADGIEDIILKDAFLKAKPIQSLLSQKETKS